MEKVKIKKIAVILFVLLTLNSFSQVRLGYNEQEIRAEYPNNIFHTGYIKNNTVKYIYSDFDKGIYVYYFDKYTKKVILIAQLIRTETEMYKTLSLLSKYALQLSKNTWKIHYPNRTSDMYICLTFDEKTKTYAFMYSYYNLNKNNNDNINVHRL